MAKLSRPVPERVLARSALFRRLDAAARRPVVWISGPPGAGKTTLVASWLRARRRRCLWYDADAGDADLATFFFYLALGVPGARAARRPLPFFTPEYAAGAATFARRFFRELCDRVPRPHVLVFDDLHEVPAGSALHAVLPEALAEIPAGVCAVLISREEPPPSLARLRANGLVEEVTADDLTLTPAEAKAIARLRGGDLAHPELERVNERVRGWAAGLVLMLESHRRARCTGDAPPQASPQLVFDYFAGEVLDRADAEARQVLLETALLPRVTAAMAARLTGVERAGEVLAQLARRGYFTIRHDEAEPSFEYHPLFREFLLSRASAALGSPRLREVAKTGAARLREAGQLEAAVELLVRAEAWEELAEVLLDRAPDVVGHGRWRTLGEWIGRLPREVIVREPWLLFWRGLCHGQVDPTEGRMSLERALDLFEQTSDVVGLYRAFSAVVEMHIYEWAELAPLDRWIAAIERVHQRSARFPDPETESRVCSAMLMALVFRQPQHPSIWTWRDRVARLAATTTDPRTRLGMGLDLVFHDCWLGDLREAIARCEQLRAIASASEIDPLSATRWGYLETTTHWMSGWTERALRAATEALTVSRVTGVHAWDFMLLALAATLSAMRGDLVEADEHLTRMSAVVASTQRMQLCVFHHVAGILSLRRDDRIAREHARNAIALADAAEMPLVQCFCRITLALSLMSSRGADEGEGLATLEDALTRARRSRSPFLEFCCLLSGALHALQSGDSAQQGLALLRHAFAIAREKGFATHPWFGPEALAEACALGLEHRVEPEWVREVIRRHRLAPPPDRGDVPGWPWHIEIHTLGRFEIRRDGDPIRYGRKTQRRPLELLKLLVALGGREAGEDFVADVLWSDAEGDAARHALESTIYRTRKLLGNDEAITVREGKIALDRRLCWVDAWAFERSARAAVAPPNGAPPANAASAVHRALEPYRGPFLPGDDEIPQVTAYRVRLDRLRQACARASGTSVGTSQPDAS